MKKLIIMTICAGLVLSACGNSDQGVRVEADGSVTGTPLSASDVANMDLPDLIDETTQISEQITTVLSSVKDEASARAAVNTLSELSGQFKTMSERLDTMDESEMKMSLSMIQSMTKFGSAQMGLITQMDRIGTDHPELGAILKDEFENMEF